MFRAPVESFAVELSRNGDSDGAGEENPHPAKPRPNGAPGPNADLRKFLVRIVERHLEKKLVTATMLEKL